MLLSSLTRHVREGIYFPSRISYSLCVRVPKVKKRLQNFTLCLKTFTDFTCPYSLFYNTRSRDNELLLLVNKTGMYLLYTGNAMVTFSAPTPCPRSPCAPIHVSVSWEFASGIALGKWEAGGKEGCVEGVLCGGRG
uniref:Pentraxin (PTX) domain-containing protein n=1 Tax=Piliocolobus tephrosceles TaxID=591936 RepID=A0A8C9HAH2_9PRIM